MLPLPVVQPRTQVENLSDLLLSCLSHAELRTVNCTALRMPRRQVGLLLLCI